MTASKASTPDLPPMSRVYAAEARVIGHAATIASVHDDESLAERLQAFQQALRDKVRKARVRESGPTRSPRG